jgi:hypothetical protein
MSVLVNALGFQLAWWALVASVAPGWEGSALALGALMAAAHLRYSRQPRHEARLAALAFGVGLCVDTLLQAAHVIQFHGASLGPLSPVWLWMLWALFGLTLDASMAFLQRRHWALSAVLGGLFGPLSYYAGARMDAATLAPTPINLAALAAAWIIALPLLVGMARRMSAAAGRED